ncbi:helix-turn-helix domain-containing protein [Paenibacillus aceti]|uniref:AraC family transcriptional regulator n=1 Tax=Paenibacillus aceti TaxID=1820010 RepID=A0ABQ1WB17_9BACL|nr:helix-turn-helix domain-containing protein [Paenibacillus aceti]GGG20295.1 hypothetical protein GCM10010913_48130 [Paenibacillus aceti]
MDYIVPEWVESRFPLYAVSSIHSLYCTSSMPLHPIHEDSAVLIAIAGGRGILSAYDQIYELEEGSIMLVPAHIDAVLRAKLPHPLHAYKLVIHAYEQERGGAAGALVRSSEIVSSSIFRYYPTKTEMITHIEELYTHRLPVSELRHVQNQLLLHQLLLELLEQQNAGFEAAETDSQPSIDRSIAYLEMHYSERITREKLAAMAGVSHSHFSILFKQQTGFSPSEYLSRLRVHRAKELLLSESGTLREIAQKVGYKDEFYLSRRFKQQTGISPSAYTQDGVQRVAALLSPYASHLLMLGVEPTVTLTDTSEYVNTADLQPQLMKLIDIHSPLEQVKTMLLHNHVELIIAATEHLQQYGLSSEQLRAIAPVVEIAWMKLGWKEHLRLIARAIQRSERAEQWLHEFEQEERVARLQLEHTPVAEEIITILVVKPEGLFVYGGRNVGYVIYQSLGLQPPALIAEEMSRQGDQFHSVMIEETDLGRYAGSRILVVVYPDEKGEKVHADDFFRSTSWMALPAVQQHKVDFLDVDEWVPYNPVSIRLQLQRALVLLGGYQ